MRRISGPLTLAGFIGLALACQESDAPTTSSKEPERGAQGDGKVTAADGSFPNPGNVPSNPSPGNVPSMPSPGSGIPSNPSPGNVPSQPSPNNPSSFPSPGGGGGTATPTPTGGTATPTPTGGTGTPTPTGGGICPANVEAVSTDVPFLVATPTLGYPPDQGGAGPDISLSGFSQTCTILSMRVFFRVTAPNLQTSTAARNLEIALDLNDENEVIVVRDFNLVDLLHPDLPALQGTQMATTCGPPPNLRFEENMPPFSTASPPYSGVFRPYGDSNVSGGSGNFNRFEGRNPNGRWRLAFYGLTAPVTVSCWRMQLTLVGGGGGGGAITK